MKDSTTTHLVQSYHFRLLDKDNNGQRWKLPSAGRGGGEEQVETEQVEITRVIKEEPRKKRQILMEAHQHHQPVVSELQEESSASPGGLAPPQRTFTVT